MSQVDNLDQDVRKVHVHRECFVDIDVVSLVLVFVHVTLVRTTVSNVVSIYKQIRGRTSIGNLYDRAG